MENRLESLVEIAEIKNCLPEIAKMPGAVQPIDPTQLQKRYPDDWKFGLEQLVATWCIENDNYCLRLDIYDGGTSVDIVNTNTPPKAPETWELAGRVRKPGTPHGCIKQLLDLLHPGESILVDADEVGAKRGNSLRPMIRNIGIYLPHAYSIRSLDDDGRYYEVVCFEKGKAEDVRYRGDRRAEILANYLDDGL